MGTVDFRIRVCKAFLKNVARIKGFA